MNARVALREEALSAFESIREGKTIVTRRQIEEEVQEHPDKYPALAGVPLQHLRAIITQAMNLYYREYNERKTADRSRKWLI